MNQFGGGTKATALASVLLLALSLVGGGLYIVAAESNQDDATVLNPPTSIGGWRMRGLILYGLDEEQRRELKDTVDAMRDEGATRDEIMVYVRGYPKEHGVEYPEPQTTGARLMDEQIEGLRQLRSEIRELVRRRLGELSIDGSFMGCLSGFGHRGWV